MTPSNPDQTPSATMTNGRIDIGELLGACIDAVKRACVIIREVDASRRAGGSLGETYKDAFDPRSALTVADTLAQSAIVVPLSRQFPGLKIIAEEDLVESETPQGVSLHPLDVRCDGIRTPSHLKSVPVGDLCLFCDPLDGTYAFVEGRLEAVQSLVGIAINGTPIAGVIGQPFGQDEPIYGMLGGGIVNLLPQNNSRAARSGLVLATSASYSKTLLKEVIDNIRPFKMLPMGGAGNKMLHVANGQADMAILNLSTSLWDSAATTAIITAVGGRVTDLFGNPIQYFADSRIQNVYGVLVFGPCLSQHDLEQRSQKDICRMLRASMILDPLLRETGLLPSQKPQATDIALNLEGNPITAAWLSNILGEKVVAFKANEDTAVRYLMSEACRLELQYENGRSGLPRSIFLKRIVMKHLEHVKLKAQTAPHKLERDVTSYQVEAAFLSSKACQHLRDCGTHVPRPYHVDSQPAAEGESRIESKFLLLLEDFNPADGWCQIGLLDASRMRSTLDSLASLHAFFWNCNQASNYNELRDAIWDQGTYWVPHRQAADSFLKLPLCWKKHLSGFEKSLQQYGLNPEEHETVKNLGHLLQKRAPGCAEKVHGVGLDPDHPHRTIIHGDAKASNFFYRRRSNPDDSPPYGAFGHGTWDVGVIDFQWCGWGHPALDVAYLIAASAVPELLTNDGVGEHDLLLHYYSCLVDYLVKYDKFKDIELAKSVISFADLTEYYDAALLDISRLVISYHWDRISASPEVLRAREGSLASNSYNKNIKCAMWLVSRTLSLLKR